MEAIKNYENLERRHTLFHHKHSFRLKPRLLYAGALRKYIEWNEKQHSHAFCEVLFIVDGHGTITVNGQRRNVGKGDIIIYNADVPHAEECSENAGFELLFMALDRLEITDMPRNHLLPEGYDFIYSAGSSTDAFLHLFRSMINEFESQESFYVEVAESIARTLVMYILRIINQAQEDPILLNTNKNHQKVLHYIKENYRNDISLENIALNCHLNKYYLSHLFTQIQGVSVGKYIYMLRMEEACRRLRDTGDSVSLIARSVGYHDTGHFCRAFKKETGQSPLQYRKTAGV